MGLTLGLFSKFTFLRLKVAYELLSNFQRQLYVKLTIVASICPKYHVHNYVVPKTVVEKFSFSELKIEKVKFFTQSPTKIFCISVFNVEGCLASCLTFRPFLTLDPLQLGCLSKKRVLIY